MPGKYHRVHLASHPKANNWGYVKRCWVVAEAKIGRYLLPGEVVHHINGDKSDDSPDNLLVISSKEHSRIHAIERKSHLNLTSFGTGEDHKMAKLDWDKVRAIRHLYEQGASRSSLEETYGMTNLYYVINHNIWKDEV